MWIALGLIAVAVAASVTGWCLIQDVRIAHDAEEAGVVEPEFDAGGVIRTEEEYEEEYHKFCKDHNC